MKWPLTILVLLIPFLGFAQTPKYVWSPGEYTSGFIQKSTGYGFTLTDDNTLAGTGNVGTQGIPYQIVTVPANKVMAGAATNLHSGSFWSADSGRVFTYGQATNCQLGNGLTTGPSTTYEILTDVNGHQFDSIVMVSGGWGPVSSVPFYVCIKQYNASSTQNNGVWVFGDGTNVGLGSCITPTPTWVGGFGSSEVVWKIYAYNSFIHCITTDGKLWVLGGTDDYAANSGVNSNPTAWTQVTGIPALSFLFKGNGFVFCVTSTGDSLYTFGEYGWIGENKSTSVYTPIATPTLVNSYFPSSIFPIDTAVAAHVGYAILSTTNKLFTGGSNEVGICGTGPSIYWPTYSGTNGYAPWNWDIDMGEYVNQCIQIGKNANVTWNKLYGGPLYSFYFIFEDINGNIYGAGRNKAAGLPAGITWADSLGTRIASAYGMGHNIVYLTSFPDPLSLSGNIISSCPGCASGALTGTPCTYGTDAPSRPNTNLHANLVLTPTAGGFNWSSATSTTDASHKIQWPNSYITQNSGTSISLGVQGGESGSITGVPVGTYVINDTIVDNSWDTAFTTASVTVSTSQTAYYFAAAGSGTACSISAPCPPSYFNTAYASEIAGDTNYLNRGDVFPIEMVANVSGSSGVPIVTTWYGTGPEPIVGGPTALTGWTNVSGNVWEVSYAGPMPTILQHGDTIISQTTTPDITAWFTPSSMNTTTITDATHASLVTTGTKIIIRSSAYTIDTAHVTNVTGSVITFSPAATYSGVGGNGWKIMNNTPYENDQWQDTLNEIRIYSVGTPIGNWTIPTVDTPLLSEGTNQVWDHIHFQGGNSADIILAFAGTSGIAFTNDTITDGYDGVQLRSEGGLSFSTDVFRHFTDNGVLKQNNNNYNNNYVNITVYDVGLHPGMGRPGANQGYCGIVAGDSGSVVYSCTIDSVGYIGIANYGSGFRVDSNYITNWCQQLEDGAAVYTWMASAATFARQRKIINNISVGGGSIYSHLGVTTDYSSAANGIYLDNYTSNVLVQGNGVANVNSCSYYDHGPGNTFLYNLSLNANYSQYYFYEVSGGPTITGLFFKDNIMGFNPLGAYTGRIATINNDLTTFGTIDSNYYLCPQNDNSTLFTLSSADAGTNRTLANWQGNVGYDLHSQYLNWSPLSMIFSITGAAQPIYGIYGDVYGNKYNGTITIPSYLSAILRRLSLPTTNVIQGGAIKFIN